MRNRVLHDMWLPDPLRDDWQPPRWNTFRRTGDLQIGYASASVQDLAMVMDAHTLLARTRVRVSGSSKSFEVLRIGRVRLAANGRCSIRAIVPRQT